MLYLSIETTSIALYLLAGFLREDDKSAEVGPEVLLVRRLHLHHHAVRLQPAVRLHRRDQPVRAERRPALGQRARRCRCW